MADKIRGLTVAISADATEFKKGMTECRNAAKQSQTELNALQKSLELKFDSATFARAQKVAQEALDQTAQNAQILRDRLAYLESTGNIDTAEYRKLQTELAQTETQAKKLEAQFQKINQMRFDALAKSVEKVGSAFTSAGQALAPFSALAGAAAGGLVALGVKSVATADEIATLASQYDMSATALQRFNYVALQTDTSAEDLYKAFVKVRGGVADIATGATSKASTALQKLNIDLASFNGSEEQFYGIIAALSDMDDKTQMVAIANDIFGEKLANNLLPMINAGTDAIDTYTAEFAELGAMTDEQVAALAEFDNVMNKIKTSFKNVGAQLGAALLPVMQSFANFLESNVIPKLQKLAAWFDNLSDSQKEFAVKALLVVAALAPLAMGLGKVVGAVGNVIKVLPQLGSALSALEAHPIIAIIGLIAMILLLLYTRCEAFREAINNLVDSLTSSLQPALDLVMQVLDLIMSILQPIIDMVGNILASAINAINDALQPVIEIIQVIFDLLSPLFDIIMDAVNAVLTPLTSMLSGIFDILTPILNVALIPLKIVLQALQVPLKALGTLLGWLSPLFKVFGNIVSKVFQGVIFIINLVLGVVEKAVNFVIGIINGLIDGVNAALGWLGVHIDRIAEVKLRIDTSEINDLDDVNAIIDDTAPGTGGGGAYDKIGGGTGGGDTYNNDYSNNTTTQNVTVVIQNYAQDIDVDDMVRKINMKLAEAM